MSAGATRACRKLLAGFLRPPLPSAQPPSAPRTASHLLCTPPPAPPSRPGAAAVPRRYISCCGPAAVGHARLVQGRCGCVCPMASGMFAACAALVLAFVCVSCMLFSPPVKVLMTMSVTVGRSSRSVFPFEWIGCRLLPRFLEILVVPRVLPASSSSAKLNAQRHDAVMISALSDVRAESRKRPTRPAQRARIDDCWHAMAGVHKR